MHTSPPLKLQVESEVLPGRGGSPSFLYTSSLQRTKELECNVGYRYAKGLRLSANLAV